LLSLNLSENNIGQCTIDDGGGWTFWDDDFEGKGKRWKNKETGEYSFGKCVGAIALADAIPSMGALLSLDMSKNILCNREAGKVLSQMLAVNTVLKELDVSNNVGFGAHDGPGFAQELFAGIRNNGAMTKFDISSNGIRAEGGKALAAGLKGNLVITELNISSNRLGQNSAYDNDTSGVIALADAIPDMGALTRLDISKNKLFHDDGAPAGKALGDMLAVNSTLQELDVSDNAEWQHSTGGSSFAQALSIGISDNGTLTTLIFGGDTYRNGWDDVTPVPATLEVGMTEVDFSNKHLGSGGAIIVAAWISHKDNGALSKLDISSNSLYVEGTKLLAKALKSNQTMTSLNISSNSMTFDGKKTGDVSGVAALADVVPGMRALVKLDISSNCIGDEQERDLQRICVAGGIELAK
jgi:Ran GTPase-activating protein (RanGAP) involved in mRNA processing and transport